MYQREERPSVDRSTQLRREASRLVAEQMAPEYEALAAKQRQVDEDLAWLNIVRTPINGKFVADNLANRQIVFGWLHPGEAPTASWFTQVLAESPSLVQGLTLESADSRDPVKRQQATAVQLEQDRHIFAQACRELRIGYNEANFGIVRSTLGENFSIYQVSQAISSGAVRVSPATQQEIAQWRAEAVDNRNNYLLSVDTGTLKKLARREGAETQTTAAQQQADRQFEAAKVRDAAIGYQPLPELWRGQKLDAAFIRSCDVDTHKLLTKRFGSAALDARLRAN